VNYLAHAYRFLDNPYVVAGVALPDWLSVVGRQYRARSNVAKIALADLHQADALANDSDRAQVGDFLNGVIQHHIDDDAFHQNETFILTSAKLSVALRAIHGPDSSIRSGFLGHIVIELLLDDTLNQSDQNLLREYYRVVDGLDRKLVCKAATLAVGRDVVGLDTWIDRFVQERFLEDYSDDRRLLRRLNQIMKRVGLEQLGDETLAWLAFCREEVNRLSSDLLPK
jgi:hypothetical protein